MKLTPHPILLSLSIRLLQVTAAISPPAAKGASKGRFSACIRSEGPRRQMQDFESWVRRELQRQNRKLYQTEGATDFRERVSRPIWPSKLGLSTGYRLEIRDYALESAGGSSEPKASYRLLISAFSIVPDFLVFAAPEPRSRSHPHTRAEYVFDTSASLLSDVLL